MTCESGSGLPKGSVKRGRKALAASLTFIVCYAAAPASAGTASAPMYQFNGYTTSEKIGGDFELLGEDSKGEHEISLQQFRGRYVLLLFGFTHCPNSCPTILARAAKIAASVEQKRNLAVIFVTLDPARDTPHNLARFLQAFDPDFIGLSGSDEQIRKVADAYRVSYSKHAMGNSYTIDHSTYMYLLDRAGRVIFMYPESESVANVVHDLKKLVSMDLVKLG